MDALRKWGGMDSVSKHGVGALRRRGLQLISVVVAAIVIVDIVVDFLGFLPGAGDVDGVWSRLFWWFFIGIIAFLVWRSMKALHSWIWRLTLGMVVAAGLGLAIVGAAGEFPSISFHISSVNVRPEGFDHKIDDAVTWMVKHWRSFFREITAALLKVLVPLEGRLLQVPWWLFTGVVALLAWRVSGTRVAFITVASFLFLAVFGLWDTAMRTIAVVGTAAFISVAVAIPVGIAMSKNNLVESMMRPALDLMQVMPSFVYLIPAIYFLGLGKVPAMLATMVYAMPPAMRLTNLGIRLVSPQLKEAARAFGTTGWQMLFKVEIPLARPTIMAGVNQTIMMALAMVVIASLVGTQGLGSDILRGIAQLETGSGLMAGLGIVALAIIIDRISQGFAKGGQGQISQ